MIDKYKLLISKTDDIIASVKKGRPIAFTQFLSFDDCEAIKRYLLRRSVKYFEYGGYDDCERKVIAITESLNIDDILFPIVCLSFVVPQASMIEHRDVLGALMSLGIKRELIGDILFFNTTCVFFVIENISDYIINNLASVKNSSINVLPYYGKIDYKHDYKQLILTLSSMRADCIVSDLAHLSRAHCSELIEDGHVFINGTQLLKKDKEVRENDIISIRKIGKFRIESVCGLSKKGKIKIKILKYN